MNPLLLLLAALLGFGGAMLIYLGAPNQALLARRLAFRPAMLAGMAALLLSLGVLLSIMGAATAVFALFVLLMSVWTLAPFAALLRRKP